MFERTASVFEGVGEDDLHTLVEIGDDLQQVFASLGEVVELVGQELVTLLKSRKLLERKWVDRTESLEQLLGVAQALLLLCAVECLENRLASIVGFTRIELDVWSVLGHQNFFFETKFFAGANDQVAQRQTLLVVAHLDVVNGLSQGAEFHLNLGGLAAQANELGGLAGALPLDLGESALGFCAAC